jgi:hypothetical protein
VTEQSENSQPRIFIEVAKDPLSMTGSSLRVFGATGSDGRAPKKEGGSFTPKWVNLRAATGCGEGQKIVLVEVLRDGEQKLIGQVQQGGRARHNRSRKQIEG